MIHGVIADSTTGRGLPVEIDIRGAEVRIVCGEDEWGAGADDVSVEWLSPTTFRLLFAGEEYVFRPDDPLRARFTLTKELATAAAKPWPVLRRKHPEPVAITPQDPVIRKVWVDERVEIEAITPADRSPVFIPPPPAPEPKPALNTPLVDPPLAPVSRAAAGAVHATPAAQPIHLETQEAEAEAPLGASKSAPADAQDAHVAHGRPQRRELQEPGRREGRRRRRAGDRVERAGLAIIHLFAAIAEVAGNTWQSIEFWARRASGAFAAATRATWSAVSSRVGSVAGAAAVLARRVASWVNRSLRTVRDAGGRAGQMVTKFRVETVKAKLPAATPGCAAEHSWIGTNHGAFAVERCAHCGTVKLSDDPNADAENGLTARPSVTRRSFLLDPAAVDALERANRLDDPLA
ncbi:MAG: hypothetical protein OEM97_01735 [Acidimicrobiia bacterium]|nr:hypothetical protein [Acidimicrobiia bacterium]